MVVEAFVVNAFKINTVNTRLFVRLSKKNTSK